MEIRLRPELADLIKQDVERGAYSSVDARGPTHLAGNALHRFALESASIASG